MTAHRPRVPALDGVRGIAILLVLVFHALPFAEDGGALEQALLTARNFCWSGVDLFFVLSGFLITGILLDTRGRRHYFRNFYMRRTLRIFPLYYGVLLVAFGLLPLLALVFGFELLPAHKLSQERQLWLWTYTQNYLQATGARVLPGFGPFWSLAIEEQFYLVWPMVVALVRVRWLPWLTLGLCVAVLGLRIWQFELGAETWALTRMTHTRVDSLLFGALAAQLVHAGVLVPRRLLHAVMLVCSAGIAAMTVSLGDFLIDHGPVAVYGLTLVGVLFAAVMISIAQGMVGDRGRALLESRFLTLFGKYSYALYVFHWPLAFWIREKLPDTALGRALAPTVVGIPLVCLLATVCGSLVLAMISWRVWESRWLGLKARFE